MEGADNQALPAIGPMQSARSPAALDGALEEVEQDLMGRERTLSHTWHRLAAGGQPLLL